MVGHKDTEAAGQTSPVPARLVGELPKGTVGPYLGTGTPERVAAWAEPSRMGFNWYARSLRPGADPMPLGSSVERPEFVTVRRGGAARADAGFVVAASLPSERAVMVFSLEDNGRLRNKPLRVPTRGERVLWLDAVAHGSGTMILWASTNGDGATIEGAEVHPGGVLDHVPTIIAQGALAWQAVGLSDGVAVVFVADKGAGVRSVEVRTISSSGTVSPSPWVVREGTGIELDVDMVIIDAQLILAWTERTSEGAHVLRARIDTKAANVAAARRLSASNQDQSLVRLVAPAPGRSHGYAVWEEAPESVESPRALTIARLDGNGEVSQERATLDYVGGGTPQVEFSASRRGLGALTRASFCGADQDCESGPAPTFAEFEEDLQLRASEPIILDDSGRLADLVWGLSCSEENGCRALAAIAGKSAVVLDVALGKRPSKPKPAPMKPVSSVEPQLAELTPLVRTDSVADFDVVGFGSSRLLAWVTEFDAEGTSKAPPGPAPDGRRESVRALLDVFRVDGNGPSSEPFRVSWRARSVAGVDLAASGDRALLVWSALDNGKPEVFLTLLDTTGRKLKQRMLTRQRSEIYDVAASRVEGGWVVAWIDGRNGDPEVYAARVTEGLDMVAPGRRLTRAKGSASGLELITVGPRVLAVWSDDRADLERGSGNLHGVYLLAQDARPERPEFCLFNGAEHDYSPVLAADGSSIRVTWIERSLSARQEAWFRTGRLDESGHLVAEPARSASIPEPAADLAMECADGAGCHVAWVQVTPERRTVFTSTIDMEGNPGAPRPIAKSAIRSARPPSLVLDSGSLFLNSEAESGESIDLLELR